MHVIFGILLILSAFAEQYPTYFDFCTVFSCCGKFYLYAAVLLALIEDISYGKTAHMTKWFHCCICSFI